MSERFWSYLDDAAHFLYEPTALGKRAHVHRWHHGLHLIPGDAVSYICYRYDLALGMSERQAADGLCIYRSPRSRRRCWRAMVHDGLCSRHLTKIQKEKSA